MGWFMMVIAGVAFGKESSTCLSYLLGSFCVQGAVLSLQMRKWTKGLKPSSQTQPSISHCRKYFGHVYHGIQLSPCLHSGSSNFLTDVTPWLSVTISGWKDESCFALWEGPVHHGEKSQQQEHEAWSQCFHSQETEMKDDAQLAFSFWFRPGSQSIGVATATHIPGGVLSQTTLPS